MYNEDLGKASSHSEETKKLSIRLTEGFASPLDQVKSFPNTDKSTRANLSTNSEPRRSERFHLFKSIITLIKKESTKARLREQKITRTVSYHFLPLHNELLEITASKQSNPSKPTEQHFLNLPDKAM